MAVVRSLRWEDAAGFTTYTFQTVWPAPGGTASSRTVSHRFSDFLNLHAQCQKELGWEFPLRRHFFHPAWVKQDRLRCLEEYLRRMIGALLPKSEDNSLRARNAADCLLQFLRARGSETTTQHPFTPDTGAILSCETPAVM